MLSARESEQEALFTGYPHPDARALTDVTGRTTVPRFDGGPATSAKGWHLRRALVSADLMMSFVSWIAAAVMAVIYLGYSVPLGVALSGAVAATMLSVVALAAHKLYQARTCAIRSIELRGIGRSAAATGMTVLVASALLDVTLPVLPVVVGSVAMFSMVAVGRSIYRAWLKAQRSRGVHVRPVALVGYNEDGERLRALLDDHPELGYRIVGLIGPTHAAKKAGLRWLGDIGDIDDLLTAVRRSGVTGAVLVASAIPPHQLNAYVRALHDERLHVHLSSGLQGIAHQRVRMVPFAYEPLFYLEPRSLADWQIRVKRAVDVVLSLLLLTATLPVLAFTAALIKLDSPGPVLFRQRRVGRDGELFDVLKFRSMHVAAEKSLHHLRSRNQRTTGPLFKLADDPRVTRIGHLIRAMSIDELPQLVNVLRGEMSLVGPRPALPAETVEFDERLQSRTTMLPGLTGLWQVEARDNPSFGPYRRLDIFYIDNWSVTLDLSIIAATAVSVIARGIRTIGLSLSMRAERTPAPLE